MQDSSDSFHLTMNALYRSVLNIIKSFKFLFNNQYGRRRIWKKADDIKKRDVERNWQRQGRKNERQRKEKKVNRTLYMILRLSKILFIKNGGYFMCSERERLTRFIWPRPLFSGINNQGKVCFAYSVLKKSTYQGDF